MHTRRVIAAGVAVILLAMWAVSHELVVEEALVPDAWPWLWALACASCVVVAARPDHLAAWAGAGAMLVAVCAGRIAALWARVPDDLAGAGQEAVSVDRALFGTAVYVLLWWLLGCTWWLASPRRRP